MKELLQSGLLVDFPLLAIALEVVALLVYRAKTGRGLAPIDVFAQLMAGACLLLAVRFAVTGADYRLTLLALGLSFPAHVFDLVRRVWGPSAILGRRER